MHSTHFMEFGGGEWFSYLCIADKYYSVSAWYQAPLMGPGASALRRGSGSQVISWGWGLNSHGGKCSNACVDSACREPTSRGSDPLIPLQRS